MKYFSILFFTSLLLVQPAFAKDGRDRALPDEYECPGCGGWERYRADMAEQRRRDSEQQHDYFDHDRRDDLEEQRRRNDLLEEQNRILQQRRDSGYGTDDRDFYGR